MQDNTYHTFHYSWKLSKFVNCLRTRHLLKKFKHEFYTSWLLGALKFTKNDDPDKYEYSGYGTRFDTHQQIFLSNGEWGENTVILGVDSSSSVHADNKKNILVLGDPIDGLDDGTITAEAKCSPSITKSRKKVCLSSHYNGSNSFCIQME